MIISMSVWNKSITSSVNTAPTSNVQHVQQFPSLVQEGLSNSCLEQARYYASKHFSSLQTYEDDIDATMSQEGIYYSLDTSIPTNINHPIFWNHLLQPPSTTNTTSPVPSYGYSCCWNGYGGMLTAHTFVACARACSR